MSNSKSKYFSTLFPGFVPLSATSRNPCLGFRVVRIYGICAQGLGL